MRLSARVCTNPVARYSAIARLIGSSDSEARPIARSASASMAQAMPRCRPGAPIDKATMASARMLRLSSNAPRYCISSPTRVLAVPINVGQPVALARAAAISKHSAARSRSPRPCVEAPALIIATISRRTIPTRRACAAARR